MIYFAQLPTGAIKIGKTDDIDRRMRGLKSQFKGPVLLLKTIPGGFKHEWATHYRFRHLRVPGTEQFKPEPELMKFISKVKRVKPSSPDTLLSAPLTTMPRGWRSSPVSPDHAGEALPSAMSWSV